MYASEHYDCNLSHMSIKSFREEIFFLSARKWNVHELLYGKYTTFCYKSPQLTPQHIRVQVQNIYREWERDYYCFVLHHIFYFLREMSINGRLPRLKWIREREKYYLSLYCRYLEFKLLGIDCTEIYIN